MSRPLRAAVIGASGFGKYHAQWLAREGAEVVAYSCTTEESAERAKATLETLTGQSPKGYTDLDRMLAAEQPDLVNICTPPENHAHPALASLAAGAHVLCEKPLLFDTGASAESLLASADEMVRLSQEAGKQLAVNLQYAALLDPYFELYAERWGRLESIQSYEFAMESKGNRHGTGQFEALWVDLGPHTLTPLLHRLPNAVLDESSIRATMTADEVKVEMEWVNPDGHRIDARLRTASCAADATPARGFGFNGFHVDILARKDDDGVFQTVLKPTEGEERCSEDLMRISIRRFLAAAKGESTPLVTGAEGRRNLDAVLAILQHLHS